MTEEEEHSKMHQEQGAAWMMTLADLISLMLAFFVLLYATLQPRIDRWEDLSFALSRRLKPQSVSFKNDKETKMVLNEKGNLLAPKPLNYLEYILENTVRQFKMDRVITVQMEKDALTFSMPIDTLFTNSDITVSPLMQEVLFFFRRQFDANR